MSATPDDRIVEAFQAGEITHDAMIRLIGYVHIRPLIKTPPPRTTEWRIKKQLQSLGIDPETLLHV